MTARRLATTDACTRHARESPEPAPTGSALTVRCQVRLMGGEAGRALAAAQGRALSALLASLAETEVGQDEEVLP
ncbi:MAG TPA: hypothetical protein VMV22_14600 [Acidimicrobiales bacterium]|nr:hypothetical protein [Acidimicrobiales bacterium]